MAAILSRPQCVYDAGAKMHDTYTHEQIFIVTPIHNFPIRMS